MSSENRSDQHRQLGVDRPLERVLRFQRTITISENHDRARRKRTGTRLRRIEQDYRTPAREVSEDAERLGMDQKEVKS